MAHDLPAGLAQRATRRRRWRAALIAALAWALVVTGAIAPWRPAPAGAALTDLPPGFLDERVVGDLPFPTAVSFTPSGDMFIALKSGVVRVVDDGVLQNEPFIDLSEIVHDNDDRGLLGLAVHPQFPTEPYVYLAYTYDPPGTAQDQAWPVAGRVARVERFTADASTGFSRAVAGSGVLLLGTNSVRENIGNENDGRDPATVSCMTGGTMTGVPVQDCLGSDENSHTVGTVAFAPDGSLLVTNGDGANYNSPDPRAVLAQNLDSLAGKVLRIDPATGSGLPDNPFFDPAAPQSNRSKVWSSGLRNPFRMAIEPVSGTAWVGDVGWGSWEEINTGKGANFGWPCYEGAAVSGSESAATTSLRQPTYSTNTDTSAICGAMYAQGLSAVVPPAFTYDHSGGGASANAGAFYSGSSYPQEYQGALFIADYNRRWIRALTFDESGDVAEVIPFAVDTSGGSGPVQVIAGPDTNLYWVKYSSSGGEVRRIRYVGEGNVPPVAEATATPSAGVAPLEVAFSGANSYDVDATPMRHSWDFDDGTALSDERDPAHVFTESGIYEVTLTVTEDIPLGQSSETTVVVTVGTDPPAASIDPLPETYAVGDVIEFSGRGTANDDPIAADSHSWQLRQWHNQHMHFATPTWDADPDDPFVSRGTFEVDEHGDETWYELCLTVTVSSGLTDTACASTHPNRVEYSVLTDPVGMSVSYEDEGIQVQGPAIIRPIEGSLQTLSVAEIQNHRTFSGWADGVTERSRSFRAGDPPQALTALYENRPPTASISTHSSASGPSPLTVHAAADGVDPEGDELSYEWTADGTLMGTGPTPVLTFDSPGERTVVLTASDSLGAIATDTMQVSVLPADVLDEPWHSSTVGPVYAAGSATLHDGAGTITVGSGDIWGSQDEFRYVYRSVPGDFTATAHVTDIEAADAWARAGLMLRRSLDADAAHLSVALSDGEGTLASHREGAGASTSIVQRASADLPWLRIARQADEVTLSASTDGEEWAVLGTRGWEPASGDLVGLTASAHGSYPPTTATFADVSVTTDPPEGFADLTYVSDLPLLEASNGYGPIELDATNGEDAAQDGVPMTVAGTAYERGLGVHAPSSASVALGGSCGQFGAVVGIDDTVGGNGTVVFTVLGDGTALYTSPTVTGGAPGIPVLIDISGVSTLTLQVSDAGDNTWWDHAVWADARLACNGTTLGEIPDPPEGFADLTYVSDLPLLEASNGYGPIELDATNGEDAAQDGVPMTVAGTAYERGLGVHAPSSASVALGGSCGQFGAVVGIDDTVGGNGTVVFTVLGDGTALYTSPTVTGGAPGIPVLIDISGVSTLTLQVSDAGDNTWWDHAVWADARLACNGTTLGEIPDPPEGFADLTYVSDLPLLEASNGYGPIELDATNGEDAAQDGVPMTVAGTAYERGLGVHAPSSASVALGGSCGQFGAVVGIDDTVGGNGTVVFTVLGDGTALYTSPTVTGGAPGIPVLIDISGVSTLTLQVSDAGDNTWWDHAVWADARLACNGTTLGEIPDPPDEEPLPFALESTIATGTRTHSVTTADLNSDGLLDVVGAVPGLDAVAVAIAQGPGLFPEVTHLPTGPGTFPKYAAVVDVDGDGALDIVSANQDSLEDIDVTVFRGNGDGSFAEGAAYAACERPHEVEAADLDADGIIDLALACWGGDDVGILRGLGDGTFSAVELYPAGNAGHSLASTDVNADGMPDLAVAAYGSNRVMVLLNDGAGSFAAPVEYWSGLGPHNIQAADFDGDGNPDLLVTAENASAVGLLRGRPDGTFDETVFFDVGPHPKAAAVADLNSDGLLDIVTANTHGNYPDGSAPTSLSLLYATGPMTFAAPVTIPAPLTPFAVTVADLYGDGAVSLLAANWHSGDVTVFRAISQ